MIDERRKFNSYSDWFDVSVWRLQNYPVQQKPTQNSQSRVQTPVKAYSAPKPQPVSVQSAPPTSPPYIKQNAVGLKKDKKTVAVIAAACVVMIFFVVGLLYGLGYRVYTIPDCTYEFCHTHYNNEDTKKKIIADLSEDGYVGDVNVIIDDTKQYSDEEKDCNNSDVYYQDKRGFNVIKNSKDNVLEVYVTIIVGKDNENGKMPYILGLSEAQVREVMKECGFYENGDYVFEYGPSEDFAPYLAYKATLPNGEEVWQGADLKGQQVTIWLASEPEE